MLLEGGTMVAGQVTGLTKFGAFVSLPGGKSGMVHISEVANAYVNDIHEHLSEGQEVKVKIIGITPEGKINLSIKKAMDPPAGAGRDGGDRRRAPQQGRSPRGDRPSGPRYASPEQQAAGRSADASFEDKLKQFMLESDSKISGSRIYEQQKKSSRRRR